MPHKPQRARSVITLADDCETLFGHKYNQLTPCAHKQQVFAVAKHEGNRYYPRTTTTTTTTVRESLVLGAERIQLPAEIEFGGVGRRSAVEYRSRRSGLSAKRRGQEH
jgi:hypothetical protein